MLLKMTLNATTLIIILKPRTKLSPDVDDDSNNFMMVQQNMIYELQDNDRQQAI